MVLIGFSENADLCSFLKGNLAMLVKTKNCTYHAWSSNSIPRNFFYRYTGSRSANLQVNFVIFTNSLYQCFQENIFLVNMDKIRLFHGRIFQYTLISFQSFEKLLYVFFPQHFLLPIQSSKKLFYLFILAFWYF